MKFAISNQEKDLTELATRVFNIKGRNAVEMTEKAGVALLKANPHLADLSNLPAGTLIVIPDFPDRPPLKDSRVAGNVSEIHQQLKVAINELDDVLRRSRESEEQGASLITATLKNRELEDFAKRSPEFKARLKQIAEAAKDSLKEADAGSVAEKAALDQLKEAVGKLRDVIP
jgi:Phage Tail Protein X